MKKGTEEIGIADFRNVLDETILERGWYYYKNGWVTSLQETKGKFYEAVVEGADKNLVVFHLDGDRISEYFCSCHYKFGTPCRHLSAVLFLLEERDKPETDFEAPLKKKKQVLK